MREIWRSHNPDADPAVYKAANKRAAARAQLGLFRLITPERQQQRRGLFRRVTSSEKTEQVRLYVVLPKNDPEDESAVYGKVTGLVLGSFVHRQELGEAERETLLGEVGAVVKQILALRPCFVAPPLPKEPAEREGVFGDHFAIAVLLSDSPTDEGSPG